MTPTRSSDKRRQGRERAKPLTHLGSKETRYPSAPDRKILETFDNSHAGRDYEITFDCPEFTAICPITGQPDFGRLTITYVADRLCVESKSLKLYLFSYRNHGAFHEDSVNCILDDLVAMTQPRRMTVVGDFNPRGGIAIRVRADYGPDQKRKPA